MEYGYNVPTPPTPLCRRCVVACKNCGELYVAHGEDKKCLFNPNTRFERGDRTV